MKPQSLRADRLQFIRGQDPAVRANRLALLRGVARTMNRVADISRLAA